MTLTPRAARSEHLTKRDAFEMNGGSALAQGCDGIEHTTINQAVEDNYGHDEFT